MTKRKITLTYEFVEFIPEEIHEGLLYVSMPYRTAVHKCICGCGHEVVTPISPTDWELIFDGESISLDPSIGNWSFACRSHYWIKRNKVIWVPAWSDEQIQYGRQLDRIKKQKQYKQSVDTVITDTESGAPKKGRLWSLVKNIFNL